MALSAIRQGLLDFRAGFGGRVFLEILLVAGVNDTEENLALLRDYCRELAPDRVDVTTMSRPGAYVGAAAVPPATRARFRDALGAGTGADTTSGHGPTAALVRETDNLAAVITASVKRRPQTAAGLALALGAPLWRVEKVLDALTRSHTLRRDDLGHDIFYSA